MSKGGFGESLVPAVPGPVIGASKDPEQLRPSYEETTMTSEQTRKTR
jgi:hypothetical protein